MRSEALKQLCRSKAPKFGHFIAEFATPGIGHIMKSAGCDFCLFDMEHSGFSIETVKSAVRYLQAADLPMIVRVPSKEYHHIARICDMGAEGVMAPMVSSAAEAKRIVDAMKYYPDGKRGVAPAIAHDDYRPGPISEKLAGANERTTLFAQIETAEGVENVMEIAATPGVDCLWIGHFDLSVSLGIPGEFDNPKYVAARARVIEAASTHKKALGRLVPTVEEGINLSKAGFDFICYLGDVWLLHNALAEAVTALREGVAGTAGEG